MGLYGATKDPVKAFRDHIEGMRRYAVELVERDVLPDIPERIRKCANECEAQLDAITRAKLGEQAGDETTS